MVKKPKDRIISKASFLEYMILELEHVLITLEGEIKEACELVTHASQDLEQALGLSDDFFKVSPQLTPLIDDVGYRQFIGGKLPIVDPGFASVVLAHVKTYKAKISPVGEVLSTLLYKHAIAYFQLLEIKADDFIAFAQVKDIKPFDQELFDKVVGYKREGEFSVYEGSDFRDVVGHIIEVEIGYLLVRESHARRFCIDKFDEMRPKTLFESEEVVAPFYMVPGAKG